MDSTEEYDPTLPLDMDRTSVNITRFDDNTVVGLTTAMSDPGQAQMASANLLSIPDGRMSPGSSRTMKDFATQISEFKKENFSLKLRIFYMEERMQERFDNDSEQVFKTNIELKVECDSLRKELQDKHDLLIRASNAVACMESGSEEVRKVQENAEKELQQMREATNEKIQQADKELREVRAEADSLATNIHQLQEYTQNLEADNQKLKDDLKEAAEEIDVLRDSLPKQDDVANMQNLDTLEKDLREKDRIIQQLQEGLAVKQTMIEALSDDKRNDAETLECNKEIIANLEVRNKALDTELHKTKQQGERLKAEYSEHIAEQQQRLDEFEIAARQMSEELEKREEEVKDLTDALKDAEQTGKELADNYDKLRDDKSRRESKELLMRDKAISGLTDVVKEKEEEIERLQQDVERRQTRVEELSEMIKRRSSQEMGVSDRLRRLIDLERQVEELQSLKRDLETSNKRLLAEVGSSEELVRNLDEKLKEKDKDFQELVNKYKDLLKKHKDGENAKSRVLKDQEEMVDQFEKEKKEFSDIMNKMKKQLERTSRSNLDDDRLNEVVELRDKLEAVENLLHLKEAQLQESLSHCKRIEKERKDAIAELEAATKRRDDEQYRDAESRTRINAAKTAEIERLREELRSRDDRLQNLEDDLLHADRSAHEAAEKSIIASREAARWKEDSHHKDAVIEQLMENLEALGNKSSNSHQEQIIKLTRENVELKQLLKAREAELSFLRNEQATNDPYVESLKREIARKDKLIADERSKISEDTACMNMTLDNLRSEIENHKRELSNAKSQINSLTAQLESNKMEMMALREECKTKDRMLEDLRSTNRFPTVESEDGSSTAMDKFGRSPRLSYGRMQRFTKKKSKRQIPDDEFSILSSSTNSLMRYNTDNEFEFASSGRDSPRRRTIAIHPELNMELLKLHKEIEDLKGTQRSEIDLQRLSSKLDLQKERLRRLANSLSREQELYRKQLNVPKRSVESVGSSDISEREKLLDKMLTEVEDLRNKLADLLLDTPHDEYDRDKLAEVSSATSTILPVNQTSYLQVPLLEMKNQTDADGQQREIDELQKELESLRNQLEDERSKLLDWESKSCEWDKLKSKLEKDNNETGEALQKAMEESKLKDLEMSSLRIEVDKLRSLQLKVAKTSDLASEDESDGMGSLSRRELSESIGNLKKKLKNAEKLNELLGDQIESAREEKSARRPDEAKLNRHLSLQISHLQEQLRTSQQQLNAAQDRDSRSCHPLSTAEPKFTRGNSKSKLPIPVDKTAWRTADPVQSSKDSTDFAKLKVENSQLQKKLAATEETVRQQTEKLKKAKAAIASAGLDISLSPVRAARSHPNLFFSENGAGTSRQQDSSDNTDGRIQLSADDTGYASVTPRSERRYNSLIQAQAKELSTLRQRLKRARDTCKNLKTEYDIVRRYVSTLLSSNGPVDTMLASSVNNELQRCKHLTRKLKEQLAEWVNDASTSADSDDSYTSYGNNPTERQASQLLQKSKEIDEKNRKIGDLEQQLQNLMKQCHEPSFTKSKDQRIIPENLGYLTPASSQDDREEMLSPNTEYASLPELKAPRPRSMMERFDQAPHSSPRLNKSLPMYQRTIAVTEYLPFRDNGRADDSVPGRRRLSTTSDAENCSASCGGCWALNSSPRRGHENSRLYFNPEVTVHSTPSHGQDSASSLKRKLEDAERLNESLKEELEITTDALNHAKNQTRSNKNPADLLEEHLQEIRALRQRLENSINTNDTLRQQLEWKLKQAPNDHVSTNIYLPADMKEGPRYEDEMDGVRTELAKANDEIAKLQTQLDAEMRMKDNYAAAFKELERLNVHTVESSTQTEMEGCDIEDMKQAMAEKDEEILKLHKDLDQVEDQLKNVNDRNEVNMLEADAMRQNLDEANQCATGLKDDLNRVNEELDESHGLVRSLKSELALYEKYYKNKGISDARSAKSVAGSNSNGKHNSVPEEELSRQRFSPLQYSSGHMQSQNGFHPEYSDTLSTGQVRSNRNLDPSQSEQQPFTRGSVTPLKPVAGRPSSNWNFDPPRSTEPTQPKWDFDISEFLSEIRSLRIQLERSIEINSELRKQLQKQLRFDKDAVSMPSPGRTTTINIHHMSPNMRNSANGEDNFEVRLSEGGRVSTSAKRKLDLSKEFPSNFPITPPPSASSLGDDGFEFATLSSPGSQNNKQSPDGRNFPCHDSHGSYVIGKRKDYKELRQVITDGRLLLHKMEMKASGKASPGNGTPPRNHHRTYSDDGLRILQRMLEDCRRLLKQFWPASLPSVLHLSTSHDIEHGSEKSMSRRPSDASSELSKGTKDAGFASDTSINSEADGLRKEVRKLHKRLSAQDKLLQSTVDRLQSANRLKEGIEHAILKQLTVTHDVLQKARGNLEAKTLEGNSKEKPKSK